MKIEVALEAKICGDECTDEDIEATFHEVMEALIDAGAQDPFVGGSVASRQLEIAVVVDAEAEETALESGMSMIRAALQSAGMDLSPDPARPSLDWSSTSIRPAV